MTFRENVPCGQLARLSSNQLAILGGIHTVGNSKKIYVNPDLPDWLPSPTLRNLRAGRGGVDLHMHRDKVDIGRNTTGFEVVHGRVPRPPLMEVPLARAGTA